MTIVRVASSFQTYETFATFSEHRTRKMYAGRTHFLSKFAVNKKYQAKLKHFVYKFYPIKKTFIKNVISSKFFAFIRIAFYIIYCDYKNEIKGFP